MIVGLILLLFLGVDPNSGQPIFTVDTPPKDMTYEQCLDEANRINHDSTNPYTAVCAPKIGDKDA